MSTCAANSYWSENLPLRRTDSLFLTHPPPPKRPIIVAIPPKKYLPFYSDQPVSRQVLSLRRPNPAKLLSAEALRRVGRGNLSGHVRFRSPLSNAQLAPPVHALQLRRIQTVATQKPAIVHHHDTPIPESSNDIIQIDVAAAADDDNLPRGGAIRRALEKVWAKIWGRSVAPEADLVMPDNAFAHLPDSRVITRERLDAKLHVPPPVPEPIIVLLYNPALDMIAPQHAPVAAAPVLASPAPVGDSALSPSDPVAPRPTRSFFSRLIPHVLSAPQTPQGTSADTVAVASASDLNAAAGVEAEPKQSAAVRNQGLVGKLRRWVGDRGEKPALSVGA
ncbi:hypothetical protein BDK51DRAFT_48480 [Blyttiomyces helicus]|uniref:Uncharacterized protein n=1 Tax=Blyttiomyces helicus TaxID=388810 RepID=A0A4P9WBB6_9FUNG|nr:hypothetical protein BDK51DRAFT_48480 [Blyttiomyces helicus]|eukprot:RKO87576.1 hypothetical protein BDK51DRAFT_48480 [Blyttiomyces helicus]